MLFAIIFAVVSTIGVTVAGATQPDHLDKYAVRAANLVSSYYFNNQCMALELGGDFKVGKTTLQGTCVDKNKKWWNTELNLNRCLGESHGDLLYQKKYASPCFPRPHICHNGKWG